MKQRLDFAGIAGEDRLYGRETELAALEGCIAKNIQQFKEGDAINEAILLHGYSGSGKSALMQHVRESMKEQHSCLVIKAKCDPSDPYAMSNAFDELCDYLADSDDASKVTQKLQEAFSNNGATLLLNAIPKLSRMLPNIPAAKHKRSSSQNHLTMTRLCVLFPKFVQAVCEATSKVPVMTVDDLQWIDPPSLEILVSCIKSPSLFFLGNYRENEVGPKHRLSMALDNLQKSCTVTKVPVGNLKLAAVNELISNATELSLATTMPLAGAIYEKTLGNVLFVLQFLEMLQDKELLYFSLKTYQWTWELDKIAARTDLSDNVVDIVISRLQRLTTDVQLLLKIASCFGSRFPFTIVLAVFVKQPGNVKLEETDVKVLLDKASKEGLVSEVSSNRFKFSHDRIQLAAYELSVDGIEREELHFSIGVILREMSKSSDSESWMLFVATQQLNKGSNLIQDPKARHDLAVLNGSVAKLAIQKSAFQPAAEYLENGLGLLGNGRWKSHYSLALEMTVSYADMASCVGQYERSTSLVNEVLDNGSSLEDKLPAYLILIESYGVTRQFAECLDLCGVVLKDVGYKLPKRAGLIHILPECIRVKRLLRGQRDEDLLKLPEMTDSLKIAACKALQCLTYYSWHINRLDYLGLVYLRMMYLSLKFGANETTAQTFSNYGLLLSIQGDLSEASRFFALGNAMERQNGVRDPRTIITACLFHDHYNIPLHQLCDKGLETHAIGMEVGDVEAGMFGGTTYCSLYFYAGLKLSPLLEDIGSYARQSIEYKRVLCLDSLWPLWKCLGELLDTSQEEASHLLSARRIDDMDNHSVRVQCAAYQCIAKCFLGDHEGAVSAIEHENNAFYRSLVSTHFRRFCYGLSCLALARKRRKRRHLRNGKRTINDFRKLVSSGHVNSHHLLSVLEAELASITSTMDEGLKAFDAAISTCRRTGFLQVEAIANERAGEYSLLKGDTTWASTYLSRSHELYVEWGALKKANQLHDKHGDFLEQETKTSSMGGTMRGRPRFEGKHSEKHKRLSVLGETD